MKLCEGAVIKPGIGESAIRKPHRVLLVDRPSDVASIIELAGLKNEAGRQFKYARGPKLVELSTLESALDDGRIVETTYDTPEHWSMLDDEYVAAGCNKKERTKREWRIAQRDERWSLLVPILKGKELREIARNVTSLRSRIVRQARATKRNAVTLYCLLNTWLASGGVKNSLIPNTHMRGGPGVSKVQSKKLGRKSRLELAGMTPDGTYVVKESDKEKLAVGYALRSSSVDLNSAFVLTSSVYWATIGMDGKPVLLPPAQRPTFHQFRYWGKRLNETAYRKRRIGLGQPGRTSTPGSTQDQVCAVGQMAMFDSTTNDVYLTSIFSRMKKLPPLHISLLKEVRTTVIIGFYVGWSAPSTWTAHQAILCGAESKVDICARFGIHIEEKDWPSMLCKLILADNGELKSEATTAAEEEFRFSVEYTRSWSGQSKSAVETQHHTHHKELDHKLPGTTRGKRRERGEEHPALEALWNFYEYMREFLLMVIAYNNEEAPELAPSEMIMEGVRPTRINILNWMLERNMRADLPYDLNRLRAFTLPQTSAVMTKRGIRLLMPDGRSHMPGIRFYSPALEGCPQFRDAVAQDKAISIKIRLAETDTRRVWFALPGQGLTGIPNVASDDDMKEKATVIDLIQWAQERGLAKAAAQGDEEQKVLDKVLRREGTTNRAKRELASELAACKKRPSKKSVTGDLRKNRAEEMRALQYGACPPADAREGSVPAEHVGASQRQGDAASDAMEAFMEGFAA